MASLDIPNSFQNGTPSNALDVNENFDAVKSFAETKVVHADGSVKATAASITDGAITPAKLSSGTFALTYQDHNILTDLTANPYGQEVSIFLSSPYVYTHVVGMIAWGVNSNAKIWSVNTGAWSGVQAANEIKAWVQLGNNVASNYVNIRVWLIAQ